MSKQTEKQAQKQAQKQAFLDRHNVNIDVLKAQHGDIFIYLAVDGKGCILKSPNLQILDACRTISAGSSIKFDQALVLNTWVMGDDELKQDKYQMGLFDWLGGIINKVEGELEKL